MVRYGVPILTREAKHTLTITTTVSSSTWIVLFSFPRLLLWCLSLHTNRGGSCALVTLPSSLGLMRMNHIHFPTQQFAGFWTLSLQVLFDRTLTISPFMVGLKDNQIYLDNLPTIEQAAPACSESR